MKGNKEKVRVLWIGDFITPTGFSRVNHSIIENLPRDKYEILCLGVNYYGDPHKYDYLKVYPAGTKGHIYGFNRIGDFVNKEIDLIFILNDLWIIHEYLSEIKKQFKKIPRIVTYMPMDSTMPDHDWFEHFDVVDQAVVYTQFGYDAVKEVHPEILLSIIPHGIDTKTFYKFDKPKIECKMGIFPAEKNFLESWIVLNANRNQPRKRIHLAFEGFAQFAKDKPKSIKYYHHAGISDVGYDILRLAKKFGKKYNFNLEERLIVTNTVKGVQTVTDEKLNAIYNATDVGINSSLGEGWGLTNVEHAVTGAPQIVPDHSSCQELFRDCGLLIPTSQELCFEHTLTFGKLVTPEAIAEQLEILYNNKDLYNSLSKKALAKFTSKEYSWKEIAKTWNNLFMNVL